MNLAFRDLRHHPGRFVATSAVIGLLFSVVLAMAGLRRIRPIATLRSRG